MAESQSRYSIMENLNNKKLKIVQEKAILEKELSNQETQNQSDIDRYEENKACSERNYKKIHARWKKEKEVELELYKSRTARKIEELTNQIKDKDATYEAEQTEEIDSYNKSILILQNEIAETQRIKKLDIKGKDAELVEVEKAIASLKELSKEEQSNNKAK